MAAPILSLRKIKPLHSKIKTIRHIKSVYKVFKQKTASDFTFTFLVFSLWLMRKSIPLTKNWQFHNRKNQWSKVWYSFELMLMWLLCLVAIYRCREIYGRMNILWEINISMIVFVSFLLFILPLTLQCDMAFERLWT